MIGSQIHRSSFMIDVWNLGEAAGGFDTKSFWAGRQLVRIDNICCTRCWQESNQGNSL
jgi:hypothetical protein